MPATRAAAETQGVLDTGRMRRLLEGIDGIRMEGRVAEAAGAVVEVEDLRIRVGDCCRLSPGAGGVGIEASPSTCHFITYAGRLEADPAQTLNRLRETLDFKNQPAITLHAIEQAAGWR